MRYAQDGYSVEVGAAKGRPFPDWFLDGPEIPEGAEFYLAAWRELSTTRSFNLGIGPIPWDTIVAYGQFHQLEYDILRDFIQIIFAIDCRYLEMKREEMERQDKPDG